MVGFASCSGAADTLLILRRDRTKADATLFVTGRDVGSQYFYREQGSRPSRFRDKLHKLYKTNRTDNFIFNFLIKLLAWIYQGPLV